MTPPAKTSTARRLSSVRSSGYGRPTQSQIAPSAVPVTQMFFQASSCKTERTTTEQTSVGSTLEAGDGRLVVSPSESGDLRKADLEKGEPDDGACSVCTEASSSDQTVRYSVDISTSSTPDVTPEKSSGLGGKVISFDLKQDPIPEEVLSVAELICSAARCTQQSEEGTDLAMCLARLLRQELQKRKRRKQGFWQIIWKMLLGCACILAAGGLLLTGLFGAAPALLPPS